MADDVNPVIVAIDEVATEGGALVGQIRSTLEDALAHLQSVLQRLPESGFMALDEHDDEEHDG